MPEAWHVQNGQGGMPGDIANDYFDLASSEESSFEEESSYFSDDESVGAWQNEANKHKEVIPILIHDNEEGKKPQETVGDQMRVQIQTPSRTFSGCRRKIPRTPVPDRNKHPSEASLLELQSRFESWEVESQGHIKEKCPLQIQNSSLLKRRAMGTVAM